MFTNVKDLCSVLDIPGVQRRSFCQGPYPWPMIIRKDYDLLSTTYCKVKVIASGSRTFYESWTAYAQVAIHVT